MYIHLGHDTVVLLDDVVGIFDLETSTIGKATRDCLTAAEKAGDVVNVTVLEVDEKKKRISLTMK